MNFLRGSCLTKVRGHLGRLSNPDVISRDTKIEKADLEAAMRDRIFWRDKVKSIVSTAVEE